MRAQTVIVCGGWIPTLSVSCGIIALSIKTFKSAGCKSSEEQLLLWYTKDSFQLPYSLAFSFEGCNTTQSCWFHPPNCGENERAKCISGVRWSTEPNGIKIQVSGAFLTFGLIFIVSAFEDRVSAANLRE